MISTGFPQADSLGKAIESDITCSGLLSKPARSEELIGRYAGLTLADFSDAFVARFHAKYKKTDGCWLWTGALYERGYGMVCIGRRPDGRQHNNYAHRAAYVLAKGSVPAGCVVRHTCDTPACVNPAHLIVGTQGDNNRDTVERRRHVTVRPWLRKLSDAQVHEIRTTSESSTSLAKRFNVTLSCICQIRNGKSRKAA